MIKKGENEDEGESERKKNTHINITTKGYSSRGNKFNLRDVGPLQITQSHMAKQNINTAM